MPPLLKITQLESFPLEIFHRLASGFTSRLCYDVERTISEENYSFRITLRELTEPYTESFVHRPGTMEYYREIVGDGTGNCFTVVLDKDFLEWKKGDVCAIAVCANESWNGTQILWEFHVHPDFQGQGIGRQLMDHICDIARKQGLTRLEVETKNRNVGAIRFYKRMGFELEKFDLTFYTNNDFANGDVAFFLKKRLVDGPTPSRDGA